MLKVQIENFVLVTRTVAKQFYKLYSYTVALELFEYLSFYEIHFQNKSKDDLIIQVKLRNY